MLQGFSDLGMHRIWNEIISIVKLKPVCCLLLLLFSLQNDL